jgi:superfamily II DNA/RNA helicase
VIPAVHTLLWHWERYKETRSPFALVLAPTRELAMQISSVMKETCRPFKEQQRRVEVVNIVGGMSEHKQRRQLDGTRPIHFIVATPVHSLVSSGLLPYHLLPSL